jgi:DNA-binding MarR family transcriptional regulator
LRTSRAIEAELRDRLRVSFETTMPRFDVMATLAREPGGMTMTALSRRLLVSNGNVTGIIERLVQDGLIVRVAAVNDRRATFVRLTRKGQTDFARMAAAHERWIDDLLGQLSSDDMTALQALLQRASPRSLQLDL